jgi:hypothetical protein
MGSPYCLHICVPTIVARQRVAHVSVCPPIFSFSMWSVSYQRKTCALFFPELLVCFIWFVGRCETESTWYLGYNGEYGAFGGMKIGRGNRSTRRKPVSVPLRAPQISHGLIWARTRAAAAGNRRLTVRILPRTNVGLLRVIRLRSFSGKSELFVRTSQSF